MKIEAAFFVALALAPLAARPRRSATRSCAEERTLRGMGRNPLHYRIRAVAGSEVQLSYTRSDGKYFKVLVPDNRARDPHRSPGARLAEQPSLLPHRRRRKGRDQRLDDTQRGPSWRMSLPTDAPSSRASSGPAAPSRKRRVLSISRCDRTSTMPSPANCRRCPASPAGKRKDISRRRG